MLLGPLLLSAFLFAGAIKFLMFTLLGCFLLRIQHTNNLKMVPLHCPASVLVIYSVDGKLMQLGSPNRINDFESKSRSEFDRRLTSIRISTIKIESKSINF